MKVIYIHQHFSTRSGQAGTRSYEFAKHMITAGDHVDMICGRNKKSNFDFAAKGRRQVEDIDGITTHIINVPYAPQMGFLRRVLAFFSFAFWATVEGLRCEKPDLIFATSTPITVAIPGIIISILKRRPLVFEVRDIWPESAVATGVLKNRLVIRVAEVFERLIYRRSKMVVAISDRMKTRMIANSGISGEKVDVVHMGSDLDLFGGERDDSFRRANGLEGKFLAVFSGAHGIANGLDLLVEAAKLLPDDIRIIMIGQGREKSRLQNKAADLGANQILFFDSIQKTELARVLTTMDCGLMILQPIEIFETGAPNKFFDYAASGLPIIVNFKSEAADLVRQHKAGSFVDPSTPESLVKTLIDLRDQPELKLEMAKNSRKLAVHFDREKMASKFRNILVGAV